MNDYAGYHRFGEDKLDGDIRGDIEPYGSFEVYLVDDAGTMSGWYWHACFPGCLPDGEPYGPFLSAKEAYDSAQEGK